MKEDFEEFMDFPVEKYKDRYKVSSYGKIWSNSRKKYIESKNLHGHELIFINNNGKKEQYRVDIIIATSFYGKSELYIQHIDDDKKNNNIKNLRYITIEEYLFNKFNCLWKKIENYNEYFISSSGLIWSLFTENLLKTYTNDNYIYVKLGSGDKRKSNRINRLVAKAFIDNPNNYPIVNHKDGIKHNNNMENLEWVNHSMNSLHSIYSLGNISTCNKITDKIPSQSVELKWLINYLITKDGKVYSKKTHKFLKHKITNGYYVITANKKKYYIHRLVAFAFINKNSTEQIQVNHKNMNKLDNNVDNLEWVTSSENTIHSKVNNPIQHQHLQKKVAQINKDTGDIINIFCSINEAGRKTLIHKSGISLVCNGNRELAGKFKWKFID
jgi:hypothetical protein